jgi:hypothetical protein
MRQRLSRSRIHNILFQPHTSEVCPEAAKMQISCIMHQLSAIIFLHFKQNLPGIYLTILRESAFVEYRI